MSSDRHCYSSPNKPVGAIEKEIPGVVQGTTYNPYECMHVCMPVDRTKRLKGKSIKLNSFEMIQNIGFSRALIVE